MHEKRADTDSACLCQLFLCIRVYPHAVEISFKMNYQLDQTLMHTFVSNILPDVAMSLNPHKCFGQLPFNKGV